MSSNTETGAVIELTGVTKRYGRTEALQDFSLSLAPGTALGFLGPNGAGKSTAIRQMMGLQRSSCSSSLGGSRLVQSR